jgi:formamidopyrimidine-DNA glycosylase
MPELAEVEYYRKCWDCGLGHPIVRVALHAEKRLFRRASPAQLRRALPGEVLRESQAAGKQLLFRFTNGRWLGLHLGMTGKLLAEPATFDPGKHDHLVLYQSDRALVFRDPRTFGQVRFHLGSDAPPWWASPGHDLTSPAFSRSVMADFLARHGKLTIKAALLLQAGFPGVGNWMADEILWRAGLNPFARAGTLSAAQVKALWMAVRYVCRGALKSVGTDFSDPPANWLFHERWGRGGCCPRHKLPLERGTSGGRATAWCPRCQP